MSPRSRTRLARALWSLEIAGTLALITLFALNHSLFKGGDAFFNFITPLIGIAYVTVGAVIAARRGNALGWMFCALGLCFTFAGFGEQYPLYATVTAPGSLPGPAPVAALQILFGIGAAMIGPIFLLFPDGRVPSPRWRPLKFIVPGGAIVASLLFALRPGPLNGGFNDFGVRLQNPFGIPGARTILDALSGIGILVALAGGIGCVVALVLRFRRSRGEERQQIRWLAYVGAAAIFFFVMLFVTGIFAGEGTLNDLTWLGFFLSLGFGIPVACGIAILRYRLYDLDVVIKKTVVVGVLAVFITLVYVAIVIAVPLIVRGSGRSPVDVFSLIAAVIVALAFNPARNAARRLADRLVYGKRATPYEVLSEFAERLGGTYSTEDVLPRLAQIVAAGTGAREAGVWLRVRGELRAAATWPAVDNVADPVPMIGDELPAFPGGVTGFPVQHQGELLGAVTVAMPLSDPLTPDQERLLRDVAAQAGLVLRNVRLIEELRESRRRIVAAQDERAKALERNIHDGAQQQLVALAVKTRLAQSVAQRDSAKTAEMLGDIQTELQDALENLRDLARGIYPPLLADKGLASALDAQGRKAPVPVEIHSNGVGRYAQEVEAAVYFCALEALQNIAKYAVASRATVRLSSDHGGLTFAVEDDGVGFDPATTPFGSGLQNMADRLAALGGSLEISSIPGSGTTVSGRVPIGAKGAP